MTIAATMDLAAASRRLWDVAVVGAGSAGAMAARERLFLLGDAAGYIEPFTGEGIAWALAVGRAVAPLATRAVRHWHPGLSREWDAIYRRLIGPRQRICRVVARVLRSPALTGTAVRILAFAPRLVLPLTHYLGCAENSKPKRYYPNEPPKRSQIEHG